MAVRVIKERTCDCCGSNDSVERWRVTNPAGRQVSPDLCVKCAGPFVKVMERLPEGKRGQTQRRVVVSEAYIRKQRKRN
jgi:hypothetical protein